MRVLWVHNFDPASLVAGVFMRILFDRLTERGLDVTLHYTGSLRGIGRILASAWRVRRRSRHFDVVHAQYGSACGYVGSFAVGRKLLWLRGTDLLGSDVGSIFDLAHGVCNRWLTRHSLRCYERIITVSQRMKAEVLRLCPDADVEVLPSGIDLQQFRPMDRQEARRQLGENDDQSPWILVSSAAGAADPLKRIPLALKAVQVVQSRCPEAKLKFLTEQAHDRVPFWINASDAVLLTSSQEGWPNIIKEALACNVPFTSTDVSDLRAIADVEPSCTVTAADPQSLADGVLRAIRAGRPETLRRHVESMDLDAVARRVMCLYDEMSGLRQGTSL